MKLTQNQKVSAALREAADWLESHPELPNLYVGTMGCFSTYQRSIRNDIVLVARAMGHADKTYYNDSLFLSKDFGGVAQITYAAKREQVCEKVVVGKRVVPPEPERIIPAQPEREEEIVEWRCKPLMNQDQLEDGPEQLPASVDPVEDKIPF